MAKKKEPVKVALITLAALLECGETDITDEELLEIIQLAVDNLDDVDALKRAFDIVKREMDYEED